MSDALALTGAERAAALLLAMGAEAAGRLLKHFDAAELRALTQAATGLGTVAGDTIRALADDLAAQLGEPPDVRGSREEAAALLAGAFPPDHVAGILADSLGEAAPPSAWRSIGSAPDPTLLAFLEAEHPQVAAYVLTRLAPDHAVRILAGARPMLRLEWARRMLACGVVGAVAEEELDAALLEGLASLSARPDDSARPARMAEIVNRMEPAQMADIVRDLDERRPADAAALKKLLFSFDDVAGLSQAARLALFDSIPTETVVLALRGAEPDMREAVLSALGARARRMAESELSQDVQIPAADVTRARRAIAERALSLSQAGRIVLREAA